MRKKMKDTATSNENGGSSNQTRIVSGGQLCDGTPTGGRDLGRIQNCHLDDLTQLRVGFNKVATP